MDAYEEATDWEQEIRRLQRWVYGACWTVTALAVLVVVWAAT